MKKPLMKFFFWQDLMCSSGMCAVHPVISSASTVCGGDGVGGTVVGGVYGKRSGNSFSSSDVQPWMSTSLSHCLNATSAGKFTEWYSSFSLRKSKNSITSKIWLRPLI